MRNISLNVNCAAKRSQNLQNSEFIKARKNSNTFARNWKMPFHCITTVIQLFIFKFKLLLTHFEFWQKHLTYSYCRVATSFWPLTGVRPTPRGWRSRSGPLKVNTELCWLTSRPAYNQSVAKYRNTKSSRSLYTCERIASITKGNPIHCLPNTLFTTIGIHTC